MIKKLYAQRIFCHNWQECVDFYQSKLSLAIRFISEDLGWAEFELGTAALAVEQVDANDAEAKALVGRFVGVSLQVDDMQAAYQHMSKLGVEFSQLPERQEWGGILAHFKDPAGNILTLVAADPDA